MTAKLKGKATDAKPEGLGRPSKFTPERCSDIVDAIRNRIPYQFAAEANGISERTLFYWLELGSHHQEEGIDSDYADFLQSIKKAEMTKIREHSDMIAAKPERWQADAWLLERRWPKHYSSNNQLNELNNRLANLENGESNEKRRYQESGREDD